MLAPICLFTYNRLFETKKTIQALQNNYLASSSKLYIFSDGPKNENDRVKVELLRKYLRTISGFESIQYNESLENKGLANSVIDGVQKVLNENDTIIVLEDDLVSTPNFLNFMNQALDYYQLQSKIQSVNAYSLQIKDLKESAYFQTRPASWGWATWSDRWDPEIFNKKIIQNEVSLNPTFLKDFTRTCGTDISRMLIRSIKNKNDSWYVRWAYNHFRTNRYSVFPEYSFISNIGHGIDATHCKGINSYPAILINEKQLTFELPDFREPDPEISRKFLHYFSYAYKLQIRLELLKNHEGRKLLLKEINTRFGISNGI